jgi:hypothetical protein
MRNSENFGRKNHRKWSSG